MSTNPTAETCTPDTGCVVPGEFVRLRYFFGQRLGVLELTDEQAYVVGKQRFHNQRLHGAGVLCGLRAERYAPAGQTTTTLLKVSSGAAIDPCGREIVVGWDSCIDVAAWVGKHRSVNPDLADPKQSQAQRVWIVICYQECPSDPAPAPRDPCGCEAAGCEHSRVREGFRLDLVTESDLPAPVVVEMASKACPEPSADPCLVLARADLAPYDEGGVTDITGIEHLVAERAELWSTAAIQAALAGVIDASDLDGALAGGPRFGEPIVVYDHHLVARKTGVRILLPILRAEDGTGKPSPILGDPAAGMTVVVRRLLDDGTWAEPVTGQTVKGKAAKGRKPQHENPLVWNKTESRLEIVLPNLDAGGYRLSVVIAPDTPILDAAFRELLPRTIGRWFRFPPKLGRSSALSNSSD